jgi:uncharacterized protein (TIGR03086 family)
MLALDAWVGVGDEIHPHQLVLASMCDTWTMRDVLNHTIGVIDKFASFAAGLTDAPHAPPGDLVGEDHHEAMRAAQHAARSAWATHDAGRRCHLPFGTFSAEVAAGINLFDVLAHTWDIATPLGLSWHCPDSVWAAGLDAAIAAIGDERNRDQYEEQHPTGLGDPPDVRLLCFLGRNPHHEQIP